MTLQTLPKTIKVRVDVRPSEIVSAYVDAPFDKAQETLEAAGFRIISLDGGDGNAALRIQEGAQSSISRNNNCTREGVLYLPREENSLVRHSPVLYSAKEATEARRRGEEFYPTQERIEEALEDSVRFPDRDKKIPTNRFKDEELTVWAFGDEAEDYGSFLREEGVKKMPVWPVGKDHINEQKRPFVRQLWFGSLDFDSPLDGVGIDFEYGRGLSYSCSVRGLSEKAGEARHEIEAYPSEQVDEIERIVSDVRKGNLPASQLEQAVEFLRGLKQ